MGAAPNISNANPLLDKKLINAFVDGVSKTLATMAGTQTNTGTPTIEKEFSTKGDVAGLIGMVAGQMKGTLTISFEKETLFFILENMLGEPYTELNEQVADAVGELTNMIYGCAKTTLNEMGYGFEMAIPTVVMGRAKIKSFHTGATLVIPFTCTKGKFFIEITVQP